jgi:hypothetical protein
MNDNQKTVKVMGMVNAARYLFEELEHMTLFDGSFTGKVKNQMKQVITSLERIGNLPFQSQERDSEVEEQFVGMTEFVRSSLELHYKVQQLTPAKQLKFQAGFDKLLKANKLD